MPERLEAEEQIASTAASAAPVGGTEREGLSEAQSDAVGELDKSLDHSLMPPHVQELIKRCLDGSEPIDGPIPALAPKNKFFPHHVNIAVLRAAGFQSSEIAKIVGMSPLLVQHTVKHPYSIKLIAAIVPQNTARVIDIRTRLDKYGGVLLDELFQMALESDDMGEVREVTWGMLDRAGYGVKKEATAAEKPRDGAIGSESTMKRLAAALDGSNTIKSEIMPQWKPTRPPDEVAEAATPAESFEASKSADDPAPAVRSA